MVTGFGTVIDGDVKQGVKDLPTLDDIFGLSTDWRTENRIFYFNSKYKKTEVEEYYSDMEKFVDEIEKVIQQTV